MWVLTAVMIAVGALVSSCSDDKKNEPDEPVSGEVHNNNPLVGSWRYADEYGYQILTFNNNETGRYVQCYSAYPDDVEDESFRYTYNAKTFSLKMHFGDEIEYWSVDEIGADYVVIDGDRYRKI